MHRTTAATTMTTAAAWILALGLLGTPVWSQESGESKLETTHAVFFENGRVLRGNLSDESTEDVVVLSFGEIGTMRIDRAQVKEIRVEAGSIVTDYPEPPARPERDEPDPTLEGPKQPETPLDIPEPEVDPILQARIDDAIRELGRWRTQNRVRAERRLTDIGREAVEALIPVAESHPFDLTRRAAFRVLLSVKDERAIPTALDALDDPDRFIRGYAVELLRTLMNRQFGFDPEADPRRMVLIRQAWRETLVEAGFIADGAESED